MIHLMASFKSWKTTLREMLKTLCWLFRRLSTVRKTFLLISFVYKVTSLANQNKLFNMFFLNIILKKISQKENVLFQVVTLFWRRKTVASSNLLSSYIDSLNFITGIGRGRRFPRVEIQLTMKKNQT